MPMAIDAEGSAGSSPTTEPERGGPLAIWGRFAARHHWVVLFLAIDVIFLVALTAREVGVGFADQFSAPGTESQAAVDLLAERFPSQAGSTARLVFQSETHLSSAVSRQRIDILLEEFAALPGVVLVRSPNTINAGQTAPGGRIAFATLHYAARGPAVPISQVEALFEAVDRLSTPELRLEVGGRIVTGGEGQPRGRSEAIGLAVAAVVLLIAFGSLVSMGVPMLTALFALGSGLLVITIATRWFGMSAVTPVFAAMIGIGVGIDYSLFVVTRFREELAAGQTVERAVGIAVDTAGRAVIFAGAAVVIALGALFIVDFPFITALGIAGSIVVATSVLVAITVLPALLGLIGPRIDRWRLGVFPLRAGDDGGRGRWYRFALVVQRRPLIAALLSTALLLTLAAPVLDMRLGSTDAGGNPESLHSRRAYDLLAEGFGPGFNGPLLIALDLSRGASGDAIERLSEAIAALPDVALVSPPLFSPAGDAAVLNVIPTTSPQDERTGALIAELRGKTIPTVLAGTGVRGFVGGQTAAFDDIGSRIGERMPLFFAVVIGLSFLLLMIVFRSIIVPLKAAVMNLLAIGAAYGVLVAVFQWGWLAGPLGVGNPGPIESFLPLLMFAILFGLSMDYEVFLLSRIRENYVRGETNSESVALGVGQTARVITAAAAIMIAVFLSFALAEGRVIKAFGLGLATAILIDATVVRLVLVPATMQLLGDANWWFPSWLDRLLPRVHIEGTRGAMAFRGRATQPASPVR